MIINNKKQILEQEAKGHKELEAFEEQMKGSEHDGVGDYAPEYQPLCTECRDTGKVTEFYDVDDYGHKKCMREYNCDCCKQGEYRKRVERIGNLKYLGEDYKTHQRKIYTTAKGFLDRHQPYIAREFGRLGEGYCVEDPALIREGATRQADLEDALPATSFMGKRRSLVTPEEIEEAVSEFRFHERYDR